LEEGLVDPSIRVNGQDKSIFTDIERKGMFESTKGNNCEKYKGRQIPLKMSINERAINEYQM